MFERFTEKARRAIFFARTEATDLAQLEINCDCLLLGVLHENGQIAVRWLGLEPDRVREEIVRSNLSSNERPSTSVNLPLTPDTKRVLEFANAEAELLGHHYIGTEHLFLGLMREPVSFAARRTKELCITLEKVRADLAADAPKVEMSQGLVTPRVERGQPVAVRLEDGRELGRITWVGRLAAIGEAVEIGQDRYRVVDVLWRSEHLLASSLSAGNRIAMVTLTVRRESRG